MRTTWIAAPVGANALATGTLATVTLARVTPVIVTLVIVTLVMATLQAAHAGKAHAHGVAKLDVAIDGNKLTVVLESPLDSLLGFERAPRTDAERKAAADVLARLRSGGALFTADTAAQCTLSKAEVSAPVLEQATPAAGMAPGDGHGDLDARYDYTCAQPQQLRTLELGLFDAFKRMHRIDVQVAGVQGQRKVTLQRPARRVELVR